MRSHNGPEPATGPRRYWRSRSTSETDCPTEPPAYTEKRTASLRLTREGRVSGPPWGRSSESPVRDPLAHLNAARVSEADVDSQPHSGIHDIVTQRLV